MDLLQNKKIADRGIELMIQFLHALFTVLSERLPWMSFFVGSFPTERNIKKCSYVEFPNHRHRAHRKPCNEVLLKEVKLQDGKVKLYPVKVYCYNSIIATLKIFLQRPNFASKCELWRERERTSVLVLMSDVIHGRVWRNFRGADGARLMSHERDLALMMNLDWF